MRSRSAADFASGRARPPLRACAREGAGREYRLIDRGAHQPGAELFPHDGLAAVATDQVIARHAEPVVGIEIADAGDHARFVLDEILDLAAMHNADARPRCCMRQQQRLEENLIDPVWGLRRRPAGVRSHRRGKPRGARRDRDTRKLDSGRGGAEGDVVRVVVGKSLRTAEATPRRRKVSIVRADT
jgi:hypothetical protein